MKIKIKALGHPRNC